jgi:cell division protein FtsW
MSKSGRFLLVVVAALLLVGLTMLMSASPAQAELKGYPPLHFFKIQLVWLAFALAAAFAGYKIDYHLWCRLSWPVYALVLLLLAAVLLTPAVKGSHRWFRLAGFSFQPSEFAKFAGIVAMSAWYARHRRDAGTFKHGILLPGIVLGTLVGLVLLEPDYGTTFLVGIVGAAIMFIAGAPGLLLLLCLFGGAALLSVLIYLNPERMGRFIAFLEPEAHADDNAYQLLNSIYGFFIGGPMGQGLAGGIQKRFYLPDAHTDFIFAVIAEELGIAGTLGVAALFIAFVFCGFRISGAARDFEGHLLAFGITVLVGVQACFNIGVVTGRLPTKGLPLPFISYGGSALCVTLFMVGVLLQISRRKSLPG